MRVRAILDRAALRNNAREVARRAAGASLLAVVKADAYGHGAAAVAGILGGAVSGFAVATAEEALALREYTQLPVLVLGPVPPDAVGELAGAKIAVSVFSAGCAARYAAAVRAARRGGGMPRAAQLSVQFKLDTGMHRLGFSTRDPGEAAAQISFFAGDDAFVCRGVYSHLAKPQSRDVREAQRAAMAAVLARLAFSPPCVHLASGGAVLSAGALGFDTVRPGLALYGYGDPALSPVMTLEAPVVQARYLSAGEGAGYDLAFCPKEGTTVGVVPFGYADGLPRAATGCPVTVRSPKGEEKRGAVCGRVSMDSCLVCCPGMKEGDAVTFRPGEIARAAGTIVYEILCRIGGRVPRFWKEE